MENCTTRPGARLDCVVQILLGEQLRAARAAKGVSLRSVAAAIGVSPSLLSQIENGKTNPSVDTLYALVRALGISIDAILGISIDAETVAHAPDTAHAELSGDTVVQTAADTPVIEMEHGVRWERLAVLPGQDAEALRVTYQPGASSSVENHLMEHVGYEHLVIVSGELRVRFEHDEVLLHAGDSMAFDSRRPHLYINSGDEPTLGIWYVLGRQAQLAHAADSTIDGEDQAAATGAAPHSAIDVMRSFRER